MLSFKDIELIVLDVDGTLTDGSIIYGSNALELKSFNVQDGLGIKLALASGIIIAMITGRKSEAVTRRAEELGVLYLIDGVQCKYPVLCQLAEELNISKDRICYIGDDLNDLECMMTCGSAMCPSDAAPEVKKNADYISVEKGGHGAVRDCIYQILTEKGDWEKTIRKVYFSEKRTY